MDELNDVLKEILERIEHEVFNSLSDCGDDWFTADKISETMDIVREYIK